MEKKVIDQKEYLKKYLSSGDGDDKKKKKKKKMKLGAKTVKIIDDDIDLKNMRPMEENEFDIFINAEDAPQIAGVVDEHGSVDFSDKRRWKIIADDEGGDLTITRTNKETKHSKQVRDVSDNDLSPPRKQKRYLNDDLSSPGVSKKQRKEMHRKAKRDEDSDLSPPRVKPRKHRVPQSNSDSDNSQETDIPSHKVKNKAKRKENACDDSDLSPPRKTRNYDSDLSPPRKSKKHKSKKSSKHRDKSDSDLSPPRKSRKDSDSDMSPPRKNRKDSDSDLSPPRNRKSKDYDSDLSPPRKSKKHKHRTRNSDTDLSPPRRKYERDINVHISSKHKSRNDDSDLSPPRQSKKHRNSYPDSKRNRHDSPPRQHKYREDKIERTYKYYEKTSRSNKRYYDSDMSPPHKKNKDRDLSLSQRDDRDLYKSKTNKFNNRDEYDSKQYPHRGNFYNKERKSKRRDTDEEDNARRMKKTLDGKKAGLQDAEALREETEAYKKREAEHFSKLSKEVTGVGQAAVVRDTKTGKKRNLEAEAAEEREKQKRQAELDEKYAKWGKGLKQVEDREEKLKDDLYEMSKPLARYADDADLDKRLREQEREGDPMLEYIKQKQIKEGKRKPDRPQYQGSYMPNRFGIKPGHRWDGVDRSNGYEKRWFEAQNAKVARQEEAYKWSTSDM